MIQVYVLQNFICPGQVYIGKIRNNSGRVMDTSVWEALPKCGVDIWGLLAYQNFDFEEDALKMEQCLKQGFER